MARGPLGNKRLTTVGPFTYDESKPPEAPDDFQPPDEITNPVGDFIWYKNWQGKSLPNYGLTGLYDINKDRMIVENRQMNNDSTYTHDDMVRDFIEKGPFPKFPEETVTAEAGGMFMNDEFRASVEVPTAAGGAFVALERLDSDKQILEKGNPKVTVEHFYKYIYTLALIDFPEEAIVRAEHRIGRRAGQFFTASREFKLEDAYRELSFVNSLPEPKVSPR